jgi:hypothetical protein
MGNTNKLIYYAATGLLTAILLMSIYMYFFDYDNVAAKFQTMGFSTYIIYPLAIAKILGLVAIWSNLSPMLKEWAYAGFFFDFVLALSAHLHNGDGGYMLAFAAIVLLMISYFYNKKLTGDINVME